MIKKIKSHSKLMGWIILGATFFFAWYLKSETVFISGIMAASALIANKTFQVRKERELETFDDIG